MWNRLLPAKLHDVISMWREFSVMTAGFKRIAMPSKRKQIQDLRRIDFKKISLPQN